MKLGIFSAFCLAVLLMAETTVSQVRRPGCDRARPSIGLLRVDRPPVVLSRIGQHFPLDRRGTLTICAGDVIDTQSGRATVLQGANETTLGANQRVVLEPNFASPALLTFAWNELLSNFTRSVSAARIRISGAMSAPQISEYWVAGLSEGSSRIVAGRRTLEIPFSGAGDRFQVELVNPIGERVIGVFVRGRNGRPDRAVFRDVEFRLGERWTVRVVAALTTDAEPTLGQFEVVEGPIVLPFEVGVDDEGDRIILGALSMAASDAPKWSLEAFQQIYAVDRSRTYTIGDAETLLAAWALAPWSIPRAQ